LRFWPFFGRRSGKEEDPGLEKRLTALENRWNAIEAEWTEWYEKFRLLHLRLAHRQKALEKSEALATSVQPDTTNGGEGSHESLPSMPGPGGISLNAHQQEMQRLVMRSRGRS
jgi:hypothetical protein